MRVKYLAQEHNTVTPSRAQTIRTIRPPHLQFISFLHAVLLLKGELLSTPKSSFLFAMFFVQVILSEPEVDRDECEYELEKRTTAVFYSITSTQKGTNLGVKMHLL